MVERLPEPTPAPTGQPPVFPRGYRPGEIPGGDLILPQPAHAPAALTCKAIEGFDSVPPNGWTTLNVSNPLGTTGWSQGSSSPFPAQAGAPASYVSANFNNTTAHGTISNWLITPVMNFSNGDTIRFFTRTTDPPIIDPVYPDRLQVRLSTAGGDTALPVNYADTGSFTTLLLDINPTYTVSGYPNVWTEYGVVLGGLGGSVQGRLAFRYFVEDGGLGGAHSNYIGIDTFSVCRQTTQNPDCALDEGFTTMLPPLWMNTNMSNPIGTMTWGLGSSIAFPDQTGLPSLYAAANYKSAGGPGTISDWLFTPVMTFRNGDIFRFYTRTVDHPICRQDAGTTQHEPGQYQCRK